MVASSAIGEEILGFVPPGGREFRSIELRVLVELVFRDDDPIIIIFYLWIFLLLSYLCVQIVAVFMCIVFLNKYCN